jgi:hypothetical protein
MNKVRKKNPLGMNVSTHSQHKNDVHQRGLENIPELPIEVY